MSCKHVRHNYNSYSDSVIATCAGLSKNAHCYVTQLDALKRTVDRTNQDLETTRTQVSQLKKDIMDKQGRLREMVDIRESLQEKLKVAAEAQLSAEELATRMDEMMEAEQRRQKVSEL